MKRLIEFCREAVEGLGKRANVKIAVRGEKCIFNVGGPDNVAEK